MKIAVCDDNQNDLNEIFKLLKKYLEYRNLLCKIDLYTDESKLLDNCSIYDIVILDIQLNHELGTELAKKMHYIKETIQIIFYSINLEYVADAFESYGNGFLVKPLNEKKVFSCLDRVINNMKMYPITFKDMDQNIEITVPLKSILYINSKGRYTFIHFNNTSIKSNISLKNWTDTISENIFFLCKRGLIVNLSAINHIDEFGHLILINGEKLWLSSKIIKRLKCRLANYWIERI